jgi:hypothetical protein
MLLWRNQSACQVRARSIISLAAFCPTSALAKRENCIARSANDSATTLRSFKDTVAKSAATFSVSRSQMSRDRLALPSHRGNLSNADTVLTHLQRPPIECIYSIERNGADERS